MRIQRRNLRKLLIAVGVVVGVVDFPGAMVGGLLLLVGSGLHLWSKGILEQNRRLISAGPYRWTRNPFYLANLLIDLGICFVIGRWWVAAVFLPIWWISYHQTIAREEARLLTLFPEAFPAYLSSVPRLIPSGRRLPRNLAAGHFSWGNDSLAQGSEYARLLGVALAPMMIWAGELVRHLGMSIFARSNSWSFGLLVALPCVWIVKLALAETFRRPATPLLPFGSQLEVQCGVAGVLLAGAVYFEGTWAASLPGLWCTLMALDRFGKSRLGRNEPIGAQVWRYFPAISTGSIATYLLVAVLVRQVAG